MLEEIRITDERIKNSITEERRTTHIPHTLFSCPSACIIL